MTSELTVNKLYESIGFKKMLEYQVIVSVRLDFGKIFLLYCNNV